MESATNLLTRVEALESYRNQLEKKFYAAMWVATVVGAISFAGGVWIKTLMERISELESKTESVEKRANEWKQKIEDANSQILALVKDSKASVNALTEDAIKEVNDSLNDVIITKRNELLNLSTDDLIGRLQSGKVSINVSSITISNKDGVEVFQSGYDQKTGNGFLIINSKDGVTGYKVRNSNSNHYGSYYYNKNGQLVLYTGASSNNGTGLLTVLGQEGKQKLIELGQIENRPYISLAGKNGKTRYKVQVDSSDLAAQALYNKEGKLLSISGIYSNTEHPYIIFKDPLTQEASLTLDSTNDGGRAFLFSEKGKKLVYLGHSSNEGNGLLNVHKRFGEEYKSYGPPN